MVTEPVGLGAVCALVAVALAHTMLTDEGWRREYSAGRAVAAGVGIAATATLLPAGAVILFEVLAPADTLRGRTVPAFMDETLAVLFVLGGVYLAVVARRRPLVGDESPMSTATAQRFWTVVGGACAAGALVAVLL